LDKDFSEQDRAATLAIQRMVDEHLYWWVLYREWWMNICIDEYYMENGGRTFILVSTIQRMVDDEHLYWWVLHRGWWMNIYIGEYYTENGG
jgi:hypothetical protein